MKITERTALLFLDFQNDVCAEGGKMVSQTPEVLAAFKQARTNAAALLHSARNAQQPPPIVHVMHCFQAGYPEITREPHSGMEGYVINNNAFMEGNPGTEIVDELKPVNGEHLIKKQTLSPFASSDLANWLREKEINTVVLAGVVTHYAVLTTAFAAYDLGFSVIVAKDCCMSGTLATHETALGILEPIAKIVDSQALWNEQA